MRVTTVPLSQFKQRRFIFLALSNLILHRKLTLASSGIGRTQLNLDSKEFYKNENEVVVGELLSDGIAFHNSTRFDLVSGVEFCFNSDSSSSSKDLKISLIGLAYVIPCLVTQIYLFSRLVEKQGKKFF